MMELNYKNTENILEVPEITLNCGDLLPLLKFNRLSALPFIEHCFTTRLGGASSGIFSTMNLSFTRGDDPEAVMENYRRLAEAMGCELSDFVCSDQTHTIHVRRVGREDCGNGVIRPRPYTDVDGLVTDEPGVVLSTFYADCVPLYFVDPVHRAIGLSHSGWKGTVHRMGRATLQKMREEFDTDPGDVICAVGPSICQDCYEVSEDVALQFAEEFSGHEEEIMYRKLNDHYQLNLWKANEIVLTEAGILPEHLSVTNVCTCCNSKVLFSHRASKGKRGNLGAFLCIRK